MSDTEGVYKVLLGFVTIGPTLRAAEKTRKKKNRYKDTNFQEVRVHASSIYHIINVVGFTFRAKLYEMTILLYDFL